MKKTKHVEDTVHPAFIQKALDNYDEKFLYLKKLEFQNPLNFRASIRAAEYPYAKAGSFSYLTSTAFSVALSQACYTAFAHRIQNGGISSLEGLDMDDYFRLRNDGQLVFSRLETSYLEKIMLGDDFELEGTFAHSKRFKSMCISKLRYQVKNKLYGDATLIAGPLENA